MNRFTRGLRGVVRLHLVVSALALSFLAAVSFAPTGSTLELLISDAGVAAAAMAATAMVFAASRRMTGTDRTGWQLVGLGLFAWATAEVVFTMFDVVIQKDPFPSGADLLYLGATVPLVAGLTVLAAAARGAARLRTAFDAVATALVLSAMAWQWILIPVYRDATGSPTLELLISVAYPVCDIVMLACAILVGARVANGAGFAAAAVIGAGILCFVGADGLFAMEEIGDGYTPGLPDLLWFLGYLLLGSAAIVYARSSRRHDEDSRPLLPPLVHQAFPLAIPALAMPVLVDATTAGLSARTIPVLALASAGVGIVLVRQFVVLRDNARLNASFARVSEDLEERVRERTAETRQLAAVLDATTDFVATIGPGGHLRYINTAGRRMIGLPVEENLEGHTFSELAPAWATRMLTENGLPAAMRHGTWQGETALLRTDGSQVPVSQVVIVHRDPGNNVEYISTVARDISERKAFERHLTRLASHDALTGVFNRRRLLEELERGLPLARRGRPLSLAYMDLDNFKAVNDSLGHSTGDALLVSITDILRKNLRESDLVARLGGDEFAILMPDTGTAEAMLLLARLTAAIREHVVVVDGAMMRVTASIGVVTAPAHGERSADLLAGADLAMYRAKETRDSVCAFSPDRDSQETLARDRLLELEARSALREGRLALYAQPIRPLGTAGRDHYELLLRVISPEGVATLPHDFLAVAERTSLMRDIDRWVVTEAIRNLGSARDSLSLHVNLSAKALADEELPGLISQLLEEHEADAASLVFEITETAAIGNITRARDFIHAIKSLGCHFALDDFGVGYSSIAHLKNLDVDYLKIDGSFITNLARDSRNQHLVRAVVELARALGKETVAEYVGDADTMGRLREMGVTFGQGFHIGRPAPIAQALAINSSAA